MLVVGSINVDLVVCCHRFPRPGETLMGRGFARFPGGKGANQAVAAARQGAATAMVGMDGNDPFGIEMREALREAGVDTRGVQTSRTHPTGVAAITVAEGENTIVVAAGANGELGVEAVAGLAIAAGDIVVTQLEIPAATVRAVLEKARRAGARTILNCAPATRDASALCALADIVVLNETELALAAGIPCPEAFDDPALRDAVARLRTREDHIFVVTLGKNGLAAFAPEGLIVLPGHRVEVVDATGAGDCFVGALAAGLLADRSLCDALVRANAAAALSIGASGAQPAMPGLEAVEAFLGAGAAPARDPD